MSEQKDLRTMVLIVSGIIILLGAVNIIQNVIKYVDNQPVSSEEVKTGNPMLDWMAPLVIGIGILYFGPRLGKRLFLPVNKLKEMKNFCANCGTEVLLEDKFCSNCGGKIKIHNDL